MIKVLFLIQDEKMPSSRVRVLNLLQELQKEGIHTDTVKYPKKIGEKLSLFKHCKKYDITYLQKKLLSPLDVILLRRSAKKVVFDFDDAIYYRHDGREILESKSRYEKFKFLVQRVDLVIAGNRILYDYAGQWNKDVVDVPSAVETRDIPVRDHDIADEKIIIGWVGGEINLHHLKVLSPVFQKLSRDQNIQIRILSNNAMDIPSVEVKYIPWKLETQGKEISLFDIGVMPLPKNKHSEGKCGYKALQYMAAAVPPVVSDVGVNRDIVEHGREGFVVPSIDGFYDALKTLIKSKELRKEMGLNARKKVENQYSVAVVGKKLADVLKQCC